MKWIIGGAVTGWAGIVWLAWTLADKRIALCEYEMPCIVRATAARDATLIWGLGIGLAAAVAFALAAWLRGYRFSLPTRAPREASQAQQSRRLP